MNTGTKKRCMNWKLMFISIILGLCIAVNPSYALFGGKVDAFTADNVHIDSNGKVIHSAKLYVTQDAVMGMYLQNGEGSMHLTKEEQSLTISSAENPGIKGNYRHFYMMQLHGSDI
jgi:hypothetical protein